MEPIRILIADDHAILRQGLAQIFAAEPDMLVVGQAANGREAVQKALALRPDVGLMDINMPALDGVEATRRITAHLPKVGLIILTMYRQDRYVFEAIKAGARGYLLKDIDADELLRAIRAVARGETLIDPNMASKMLDEFGRLRAARARDEFLDLTEREVEILRLVAVGASNQQIAGQLHLTEKTVRNRLTVIFEKLHINNRTQAALYALRGGLVTWDEVDDAIDEEGAEDTD
jgi:DNA-binding NarL/FixJ family response regulator